MVMSNYWEWKMMGETVDKNFTYNNIFVTSEILKIVQWVLEINKITLSFDLQNRKYTVLACYLIYRQWNILKLCKITLHSIYIANEINEDSNHTTRSLINEDNMILISSRKFCKIQNHWSSTSFCSSYPFLYIYHPF